MTAQLSPYIHLHGEAAEALAFYAAALDGTVTSSTFGEFGGMGLPEVDQDHVMHGQVDAPGLLLMCSDVPSTTEHQGGGGLSIALSGDDDATLRRWWDRLSEGSTINEPLAVAPWGDAFGHLTDRFGVDWMVNIAGQPGGQAEGQAGAPS